MLPRMRTLSRRRAATAAASVALLGAAGGLGLGRAAAGARQPSGRGAASTAAATGGRNASASAETTSIGQQPGTEAPAGDPPRVASIHRFPVKSCGGEQVAAVQCRRLQPLPGDRRYMWVDAEHKFITQRPREPRQGNGGLGVPAMATIHASYQPNGALRLAAPPHPQYFGLEPLELPPPPPPTKLSVSIRRMTCTLFSGEAKVTEEHASAGQWFSTFSGVGGVQLVRSDESATTLGDDWRESRTAFQSAAFPGEEASAREIPLDDGGTILLVSSAALEELNAKLTEKSMPTVSMERFRPNFVVEGVAAHAEDDWLELQLGEVRFRVERPCTRCSTVLVDQASGKPDDVNWLSKVLARYRLSRADPKYGGFDGQGTKFGVYITPLNSVCTNGLF